MLTRLMPFFLADQFVTKLKCGGSLTRQVVPRKLKDLGFSSQIIETKKKKKDCFILKLKFYLNCYSIVPFGLIFASIWKIQNPCSMEHSIFHIPFIPSFCGECVLSITFKAKIEGKGMLD